MEHTVVLFRSSATHALAKTPAIPLLQARHCSCKASRTKSAAGHLAGYGCPRGESGDTTHTYGSASARVMTGMDVIRFESPRASQRTLLMADDCSRCREELARLTEENAALRRAALAFGGLAERLNLALQEERRARQRLSSASREATDPVSHSATPVTRIRSHRGAHQG